MKIRSIRRYWTAGVFSLCGTILGLLMSTASFILNADGDGYDIGFRLFFLGVPPLAFFQWSLYGLFIGLGRNKKLRLRRLYIVLSFHVTIIYLSLLFI